jgi:hypothetical protein
MSLIISLASGEAMFRSFTMKACTTGLMDPSVVRWSRACANAVNIDVSLCSTHDCSWRFGLDPQCWLTIIGGSRGLCFSSGSWGLRCKTIAIIVLLGYTRNVVRRTGCVFLPHHRPSIPNYRIWRFSGNSCRRIGTRPRHVVGNGLWTASGISNRVSGLF